MEQRIFTTAFRGLALVLMLIIYSMGWQEAKGQTNYCTTGANATPTYIWSFVGNSGGSFSTPSVSRNGSCCASFAGSDNTCIQFILTLDTSTAAIDFQVLSGSTAGGAYFYSIDCQTTPVSYSGAICLSNNTGAPVTHNLTFCKPGNNPNEYGVTSISKPFFPDDTVAKGCYDTMKILGLTGPITWTSVSPGTLGQYNTLLSCTTCAQPIFTPTASTPSLIRYLVCGSAAASSCLGNGTFCDTVNITVLPQFSGGPADQTICAPASTASLGAAGSGYSWSVLSQPGSGAAIGASTGSATNLTVSGTYQFLLSSSSGNCKDTVAVVRTSKPNAGSDQAICFPASTASLGAAPGGQSWSAQSGNPAAASVGASTGSVTGMTVAGTYNFILGTGSCSDTVAVVVKPQPASPTAGSNSPLCVGATLNLTASTVGGTTYSWVGPSSFASTTQNPSISNVAVANAGTYKVVSILNLCPSDTATTIVVVNTIPATPAPTSNSPVCEGDTIKLFANVSGGSFAWTGPGGFTSSAQDTVRANAVIATMSGSYCLIRTVSGCPSAQACTSVSVNVKPVISGVSGVDPSTCGGSSGTITINGLTAGQSYNVYYKKGGVQQGPVAIVANGSGQVVITGLGTGSYTEFAVALGLCTSNTFNTTITLSNPATPAPPTPSSNTPVCETDTIKLFASGEVGATFSWTGPLSFTSSAKDTIRKLATLGMAGSYCVTQTVAGCTSSQACTSVTVNPKPVVSGTASSDPTTCLGTNGTITLSGLTFGQTYSIDYKRNNVAQSPLSLVANGSGQIIITGLNAGSYSDFILTLTGCASSPVVGPIVLADPNTPSAPTVGSNSPVCEGDSIKLTASGTVGVTYDWTGPAGFNTSTQNPGVANAAQANGGSYCVTQTKAGCTSSPACVAVTVKTTPVISGVSSTNPTSCSGTNGTITLSGFTTGLSYSVAFSKNGTPQTPVVLVADLSGNIVITGLGQGNYTVFVVTLNGCPSLPLGGTISLVDPSTPNPPSVGSNSPVCVGKTINLTADGEVGATFAWTGPNTYTSSTEDPSISNATLAMSGSYCAKQTKAGCQSLEACTNVIVSPNPLVNAGTDTTICNGKSVTLGGSPTASGGFPNYSYAWTGGASSVSNPVVSPSSSTSYVLTVTDDRSCSATGSVNVNVNANPTASAGPDKNLVACDAIGISIGGSPTASGGTGPYVIAWSPGSGLSSTSVANPTVSGLGSTTPYSVVVTDANQCSATSSMTVTVIGSAISTGISPSGSLEWCEGSNGSVLLTATPSGGSAPYTYSWTGTSISPLDQISATANPNTAGTFQYDLVVTDNVGCQAGASISVTVDPKPVADAGPDRTICNGKSVQIGGTPTGSGGTGALGYAWNNGASPVANPTVSPSSTLSYVVTVTDSKTCTNTASMTVNVNPNPTANAGSDKNLPSCSPTGLAIGGSPTATGGQGPGYTYDWSPNTGLNSTAVSNPQVIGILSNETYTVTVTDENGCSSTDQVAVTVISNTPSVNITPGGPTEWCAGSGGSVTLTANVTGGTASFAYSWSGTNISPTNAAAASVNPSGANTYNYNVTVTDAFNCTASTTTSVTVNPNPTADAGSDKTICSGSSVQIGGSPTGNGGTGTLGYNWSGGAASVANPTVSPVGQTTYTVTVTDAKSCTATSSMTVNFNTNPVADAGPNKTLPSCSPTGLSIGGSPTGSGGGGAPYTYTWSPNTGVSDINDPNPTVVGIVSSQTYTVVVKDNNNCTASDQVLVTVSNNTPGVSIIPLGSTEWCEGSGGSTSLNANVSGGTANFSYSWSGSNINPNNAQVVNVNPNSSGTYPYSVTVTDAFDCTASATASITVNPNPTASAGADKNICSGQSVQIGGSPTGSGGTGGYTYAWSNGPGAISNPTVTPATNTTYQVTVTDSKTCSASAAATVFVSFTPVANAGVDKTLIGCSGVSITIGATPTATGGSGGYTYRWSPKAGLNDSTIANPTVSGIVSSTIYCVTVTDISGCSSSDCMQVTLVPSTLQAQVANSTSICSNAPSGVNIGGAPSVLGGTPPYSYAWSPTTGLDDASSANPTALPGSTQTYCLTVTDANGCSATACMTLTVKPAPIANAGLDTALCSGSCASIGGSPTASGGTGSFSYVWSPGSGLSNGLIANPLACPASTTSYTLTVSDANGCSSTGSLVVTINPAVVADAGLDRIFVDCPGDTLTMGGTPSAKFGTGPYTYQWTPSTALNFNNVANPRLTGLTTGTLYTLSVTDSKGCTSTDQAFVFIEQSTLQAEAGSGGTICAGSGDSVLLGGSPTGIGGFSRYTYEWSPTTGLNLSSPANPYAKPSITTKYYVSVTDDVGCIAVDSVTVTVNPTPTANAGNDTALCSGFCAVIGGASTASGGTPGYTYLWSPTQGLSTASSANPIACPAITTTYTVTVTDSKGCKASDIVFVAVNPNPVASAGPDQTLVACGGDSIQIGGSPASSGGTGSLTCSWSPGAGLSSTSLCNPYIKNIGGSTSYTLTVTDANGCIATDAVFITLSGSNLSAEAGQDGAICSGNLTGYNLGGSPTAVGGTPGYTYNWSPSGTLDLTSPANPVAHPLSTTKYFLTITDSKGCPAIDSVTVTVNPLPVANAGNDTAICNGNQVVLGNGSGVVGNTYSWSPGTGLSGGSIANPTAGPSTTTNYSLTVTTTNGCTAADNVLITINPNPVANAGPDQSLSSCVADSVQIGGSPASSGGTGSLTCAWSPATALSSAGICNPYVKGLGGSMTYTLTVTDAKGCTGTDLVTVNVSAGNLTAEAGQDGAICSGNISGYNIGGSPTAVGGTPTYSYSWSPNGTLDLTNPANPVAHPINTTKYRVTITDSKGCVAIDSVTVTVNPVPVANAGNDTAICNGAQVTLGNGSGTVGNTYAWSPGTGLSSSSIANPVASPTNTTNYSLTVTNSAGCTATDNVLVTVRPNPVANAGTDKSLVACPGDSVQIGGTPTGSGGTGTLTCAWSPSTGLSSASSCNPYVKNISSSSAYTIVVTDQFGCSATDQVLVNLTNSNMTAHAGNDVAVCQDYSTPIVIGGNPTVVGGTPTYTYSWLPVTGLSSSTIANPTASPTTTTSYRLLVTDASGCTARDTVTITVNPLPVANAGLNNEICAGFCDTLGGTPTASGGAPAYQYTWSPSTGLNSINIANPIACPSGTTVYSLTVTDSKGCQSTDAMLLTVNPNPVANAGADHSITGCPNDSVQLGGTPASSGGTGSLSCAWSPGTGLSNVNVCNPYVKGLSGSVFYTLTVTDSKGCKATDVVLVSITPTSLSAEAGQDGAICAGSIAGYALGGIPTAVGGSAPYSYSWSISGTLDLTNQANPVAHPLSTTKYYLTVTDSKGCPKVDSVTVTVNPAPAINAGKDTAICNGSQVVLGTGTGIPGNTYSWTPGIGLSSSSAANPTASPTTSTNYSLIVTNSNGCTATDNVLVTVRQNPTANAGADKNLVACSADSVQIGGSPSGSGGGGGLVCSWSPSGGLTNASNCNPYVKNIGSSSVYTLVVTDQFGCSATDQVLINVNNSNMTAHAGNNISFCEGSSVSTTLGGIPTVTGGSPAYTYAWTPTFGLSDPSAANPTASPSVTTTYRLAVTDASGCVATDSVRVTINPRPVVNAGLNDTVCSGSCVVLGGVPTASGGTGSTYIFSWTPTSFLSSSSVANPTACPTNNVTYTLTVTDSLNCSNSANVTMKVNQNPVADAGIDKSTVPCPRACTSIGGSPSASGGTIPYTYNWSPSTGLNNVSGANPSACNLSSNQTYTVTVTDKNGCTAKDDVTVIVQPSTLTADAGPDKSVCIGQNTGVVLGGTPAVSGGQPQYSINWAPSTGILNSTTIPNPTANPLTTTTYTLFVQDVFGCEATDDVTVTANPSVTASVGLDTSVCQGGSAILGGNPTATGGTPAFSYSWGPGTGLNNITSSNPIATPLVTTTYCVTVTDNVACSATACQTVNVNQSIVANAGPDQSMINCPGSFVILGASPTGSGGSGNYSYQWSPSVNLNGATIPNPVVTGLTVTTTFSVTVTDNATGCIAIDVVTVNVTQSTLSANAGLGKIHCVNSNTCVGLGGSPTAQGGQGPYFYQWTSVSGLDNPFIANPCASPSSTTVYNVIITDALGCNVSDSVMVFVSPLILVDAGSDSLTCARTSVTLGGNVVASGGTGAYSYSWSPTLFLVPNSNIAHPTAQNITSNITYTLSVSDSLGCSASDNISVSIRSLPVAYAGPDASIFACSFDSAILGGSPTASGTVGPYSYAWSPPFDISLSCNNCSNPVVRNLGFQTNFCVVVTDSFGCQSDPDCAVITVLPNTVVVDAGFNLPSLCTNNPGCVTLGGPVPVSGGVGPYTLQWFGNVSNPTALHPQACPTVTTTYRLIGTDSKGCQTTDTVQVIVNDPPTASISGLNGQYCISAGDVTITGIPAGGTFASIPGLFGNIFRPSVAGAGNWCIKYTYTDPITNCSDDTTICVTVNPLPAVSITGYAPSYCLYEPPVTLVGIPSGGAFSGRGVSITGTFNPASAGIGLDTITYTYTNPQTGCMNMAQAIINVKGAPTVSLISSKPSVCNGNTVVITPVYSLDVSNIIWTDINGTSIGGGTGPITVTPTPPQYCVVATAVNSPNQCQAKDTICIDVNALPVVSVVGFPATYCVNQPPIPLVGSPSGGTFTGPGIFNGAFNPAITGIGNWCIKYSYTHPITGCTGDTTVCIAVSAPPVVSVTGYQPGYCQYDPSITLTGTPSGGTFSGPGVTPIGTFTPASANVGTNVITYTYTDVQTGCTSSTTISIDIRTAPSLNIIASQDSVCGGTPITLTAIYGLNVTNIYWYNNIGSLIATGVNSLVVQPAGVDFCVNAMIVSTTQCLTRDTICIHVTQAPQANDDTASTCEEQQVSVNVLANDSNFEGAIATIVIIRPGHGTTTVSGSNVNYRPNTNFNGKDTVTYRVCTKNCGNACDTANVYIDVCPQNDPPTAVDDAFMLCADTIILSPLTNDLDIDGDSVILTSIPCSPTSGTAILNENGTITYISNGLTTQDPDTFCYSICDNGTPSLCDTGRIIVSLCRYIDAKPDTVLICRDEEVTIQVLQNDSVSNGNKLTITNVTLPIPGTLGGISFIGSDVISFAPIGNVGTVRFQYYVCDDGSPRLCDTGSIVINIRDCPLPVVDTIYDTTYVNTTDTVCIDGFVFSLPQWHIQSICDPQNGSVEADDSCFTYIPDENFFGDDTFCIVVCNEFGCDTSTVIMTVIDSIIHAIPEPCDIDTTSGTKPVTVDILANDIIPLAGDTVITIVVDPANGTAVVNDDHTITYTPNNEFKGDEHFTYMVCAVSGSYIYCDTADICITVLGPCFIPNAFSPNGDGNNDLFQIPCNDDYPEAELRVFNRWGIEVWNSEGPYHNNFDGHNMQGIILPDGTYYFVYTYNDGSSRREAKYVVIHR